MKVFNMQFYPESENCVCVFITAGPSTKLFAWGGGYWGTCATRDDKIAASKKSLSTKTISVIPTGANGNIGKTGPRWSLGSGVRVASR
jgi:hypothetical protein